MKLIYILFSLFNILNANPQYLTYQTIEKNKGVTYNQNYTYKMDESFLLVTSLDHTYLFYQDELIIDTSGNYSGFYTNNGFTCFYNDNEILTIVNGKNYNHVFSNFVIHDIVIVDQKIYLLGTEDNDAVIYLTNPTLKELNKYHFGGDNYECFYKGFTDNEYLYLIGEKDANSSNSNLKNCGGYGLTKIFVLKLDLISHNINNELYFDISITNDYYFDASYINDLIYIKTLSNDIICFDNDFHIQDYPKYLTKSLYLGKTNNFIFSHEQTDVIDINGIPTNLNPFIYSFNNGRLCGYILNKNTLTYNEWIIYEISKNDDVIVSKYYPEFQKINLDIISPLANPTISIDEASYYPYLIKNQSGTYTFNYIVKWDNDEFIVPSVLIIKPYVNVVDDGVYKINKEILFTGRAYLNNQEIKNGHKINQSGDYILDLYTNDLEKQTYHFKIVDNYYLENDAATFNCDYVVKSGDSLTLIYDIGDIEIIDIYINNEKYYNYSVFNNQLMIKITPSETTNITHYSLDKIIYILNNQIFEKTIDYQFDVLRVKNTPNINLNESIVDNNLFLNFEINDIDKTITYFIIEIKDERGNIIDVINYYLNNKFSFKENIDQGSITLKMVCHNNLKTAVYDLTTINCDNINKLDSEFLNIVILDNKINIKMTFDLSIEKVNLVKANNEVIVNNLTYDTKGLNLKTIIIISSVILIFGLGVFIIRITLKKRT